MALEHWEFAWIEQARRLLDDADHRDRCDGLLGPVALHQADAPELRWPGYLGSAFQPESGVLLVATVHREFASGRPPLPEAQRDRLVATTRSWHRGDVADEEWLAVVRETYVAGLGRHRAVGRLIRGLHSRIGLGVDQIAYVNAARCQLSETPPVPDRAEIISSVVALCTKAYPISSLARSLAPAALLMSKGTFDCAAMSLPRELPTFVVDQRQLLLRSAFVSRTVHLPAGTRIDDWAPVLEQLIAGAPTS